VAVVVPVVGTNGEHVERKSAIAEGREGAKHWRNRRCGMLPGQAGQTGWPRQKGPTCEKGTWLIKAALGEGRKGVERLSQPKPEASDGLGVGNKGGVKTAGSVHKEKKKVTPFKKPGGGLSRGSMGDDREKGVMLSRPQ